MRFFRGLGRALRAYLVLVGLAAHLVPIAAVYWALGYYGVTLPQLTERALDKAGIRANWLVALLAPTPGHADQVFDGRLRASHPRILLPELAGWAGGKPAPLIAPRAAALRAQGFRLPKGPCEGASPLPAAVCWVFTGEGGAKAVARLTALAGGLRGSSIQNPTDDESWQLALAYDLLYNHPAFTENRRATVEHGLETMLRRLLWLLDDGGLSLWHGRAAAAAKAWLIAVVLSPGEGREALRARAQGYFLDVIDALGATEGWPEGYNYWVNVRTYPVTLAAAAYVNGVEGGARTPDVEKALRRIGYWTIYGTRPDNRYQGFADEGPRLDLGEETGRGLDVIVQVTRDPVLAGYARYLTALHGVRKYYGGYRWSIPILYDPTVAPAFVPRGPTLSGLEGLLPHAEIFGRGAFDQVYMRSGWGPDDTFVSYRAGAVLTHHGHYDAGGFTLFKGAPLAINSSVYGDYFGPNRLNYSIRTVAKNSLLILRPGEKVKPNRFFADNVADGGQRIVIPTGSAITSVADWRANLGSGMHYEGGRTLAFRRRDGAFAYVASDLTRAYDTPEYDAGGSGGKVTSVTRQLLYLEDDDVLLVYDDVTATDPAYTKKWLLHTVEKPAVADARVLKGAADNGILESRADRAVVTNGRGRLTVRRLLPADAVMRLVGGRDYQFYVEADGDDSDLDGVNEVEGATFSPWFDVGLWRIEIQPGAPRKRDRFLVALAPSLGTAREGAAEPVATSAGAAVASAGSVVLFVDAEGPAKATLTWPNARRTLYVAGLAGGSVSATVAGAAPVTAAVEQGLAVLSLAPPPGASVTVTFPRP